LSPHAALQDPEVADLFNHYIGLLAPWYDLNDSQLIFGTLVPLRALECSVLFKALIAFSACHRSKASGEAQELAATFHAACVREFLDSINQIEPDLHGDYLAATCLLRSYEILNGKMLLCRRLINCADSCSGDSRDEQHLLGAYSFVINGSIDLATWGLLQAGAWNYLREEITVALECRRPVRITSDFTYQTGKKVADDMQSNIMSCVLARVINFCFGNHTESGSQDTSISTWTALNAELIGWKDSLSFGFKPYSTAGKAGNCFPSLWMFRPWHSKPSHILITQIVTDSSFESCRTAVFSYR
jgi:Fungal specific transcription factor domain